MELRTWPGIGDLRSDVTQSLLAHFGEDEEEWNARILGIGDDGVVTALPLLSAEARAASAPPRFVIKEIKRKETHAYQKVLREVVGSAVANMAGIAIPALASGRDFASDSAFIVSAAGRQGSQLAIAVVDGEHSFTDKMAEFFTSISVLHAAGFSHSDLDGCNVMAFEGQLVPNDFARLRSTLLASSSLAELKGMEADYCSRVVSGENLCDSRHIRPKTGDPITGGTEAVIDDLYYVFEFVIAFSGEIIDRVALTTPKLSSVTARRNKSKGSKFVMRQIRTLLFSSWRHAGYSSGDAPLSENEKNFREDPSSIEWARPRMQMWFIECLKKLRFVPLRDIVRTSWMRFFKSLREFATTVNVPKLSNEHLQTIGDALRLSFACMRMASRSTPTGDRPPPIIFSPVGNVGGALRALQETLLIPTGRREVINEAFRTKISQSSMSWRVSSLSSVSDLGPEFATAWEAMSVAAGWELELPRAGDDDDFERSLSLFSGELTFQRDFPFVSPVARTTARLLHALIKVIMPLDRQPRSNQLGVHLAIVASAWVVSSPGFEDRLLSRLASVEEQAAKSVEAMAFQFGPECAIAIMTAEKISVSRVGEQWAVENLSVIVRALSENSIFVVREALEDCERVISARGREDMDDEGTFAKSIERNRTKTADILLREAVVDDAAGKAWIKMRRSQKYKERFYLSESEEKARVEFSRADRLLLDEGSHHISAIQVQTDAELGKLFAMHRLATMYEQGIHFPRNLEKAFAWNLRAADLGYCCSQVKVGNAYKTGTEVVKQDFALAHQFLDNSFEHAACAKQAALSLGEMYYNGLGVERDPETAARFWSVSARRGCGESLFHLARLHLTGEGVERNLPLALDMLRKSDTERSMVLLGELFHGEDDSESAVWYKKAAEQGSTEGSYRFGLALEEGRGVDKDEASAVKMFDKAANAGHRAAMLKLADMLAEGRGVTKDEREAEEWREMARS